MQRAPCSARGVAPGLRPVNSHSQDVHPSEVSNYRLSSGYDAKYGHLLADRRCLALGRFLFDVGDDVYLGTVCHRIFIRRVGWAFTGYLRHFACRVSSASTASRQPRTMAQPFMSHRGLGRVPDHIGRHRRYHLRWLGVPSTRSDRAVSRLEPGDGARI